MFVAGRGAAEVAEFQPLGHRSTLAGDHVSSYLCCLFKLHSNSSSRKFLD